MWKNKLVQDLAWCVGSPVLFNSEYCEKNYIGSGHFVSDQRCQEELHCLLIAFQQIDDDPIELKKLQDHIERNFRPKRLGTYFEVLIEYWLSNKIGISGFRKNIPVRKDGVTLGEFDFLFYDETRKAHVHWETSVKFYLYVPVSAPSSISSQEVKTLSDSRPIQSVNLNQIEKMDLTRYYGPRGIDQLHLKFKRTFEHQIKLSETPAAKELLNSLGISNLITEIFWKGMLFYPSWTQWENCVAPHEISIKHSRGWWTTLDEFLVPRLNIEIDHDLNANQESDSNEKVDSNSYWIFLSKAEWLSQVYRFHFDSGELFTAQTLKAACQIRYQDKTTALLVAEVRRDPFGYWKECSRGFVLQVTPLEWSNKS